MTRLFLDRSQFRQLVAGEPVDMPNGDELYLPDMKRREMIDQIRDVERGTPPVDDVETWWFTMGQQHTHRVNGITFDADLIAEMVGDYDTARRRAVELFGNDWSRQVESNDLELLEHFPRGVARVQ